MISRERQPTITHSSFCLEIVAIDNDEDVNGRALLQAAHQLGYTGLESCRTARLYFLQGNIDPIDLQKIGEALLADPVTEQFTVADAQAARQMSANLAVEFTIDVTLDPGVTDPAAENLIRVTRFLGIEGVEKAATGQRYWLAGQLDETAVQKLAVELFANPVIQRFVINQAITPPFFEVRQTDDALTIIPLRQASDRQLEAISGQRRLALDLAEMQAIQAYYNKETREPTDVELEMLAQTWSEHCVHKTFKAEIDYVGPDGRTETIDGLLKTYIRAATERINKPWVHSAFVDNAGLVAFDEQFDLAFKVETHNHPSALEPFGGANTGVGGVVRDVLGVSARPIANTDILCFGPPDLPVAELPANVLHPRRIADGVVHGIEDYGNKMGIPTVNGAILYDPGYTANPLVFCGCLGILPRGSHPGEAQSGDLIVAIGGRTGRDGLRGATFSSMEMDVTTSEIADTAVQIGHPIMEKQVQEVVLRARDEQLYHAITDCGAGGFSSAVGEMAQHLGGRVQLQNVTLKYPGLQPWEIWLSEAQERMVLAVPPMHWPRLQAICAGQDVEAIQLGEFEASGRIRIYYGDRLVGDLDLDFLHDGLPRRRLSAVWTGPDAAETRAAPETKSLAPQDALLQLLAHPDIRSKEAVIRRYDHEVQGGTAVKPLVGTANHGPSDAAVLIPNDAQHAGAPKGAALSNGICPNYSAHDPYVMAWAAVDEAMRNLVAVGADPDQVSLLDNFCWGNPNLPDRLGGLVRCAQGCYDAALAYEAPFISGKDSLNNEYTGDDGRKHAIPGTLLISALGLVPDVTQAVTMDWKQPGSRLYLLGQTGDELTGSHYRQLVDGPTSTLPQPVPDALAHFRALHQAIRAGLVRSCHDLSEGGLAVTLAEMSLAGGLGAAVHLDQMPVGAADLSNEARLFSQSLSRFVVEVAPEQAAAFEAILAEAGLPWGQIGQTQVGNLVVWSGDGRPLINLTPADLESAWRGELALSHPPVDRPQPVSPIGRSEPAFKKQPTVLVLHTNGTNRDRDAVLACQLAGGRPEIVHINQLLAGERDMLDYHMLVIPGGFSYGDDLGAGMLWAMDLRHRLGQAMRQFVTSGRPVLGICNGFQVLVKAGILPGLNDDARQVTLTFNESGQFECRWVWLEPDGHSPSLFTQGLTEPIYCPVAHGEGRLAVRDEVVLSQLQAQHLIPLKYTDLSETGDLAAYPANPNGSIGAAAALCNPAGNVMGLMPHPENHIFPWQHARWQRGEKGMDGLRLFANGIRMA